MTDGSGLTTGSMSLGRADRLGTEAVTGVRLIF